MVCETERESVCVCPSVCALTLRGVLKRRAEAVHVVATVTVITEQELVIIFRSPTEVARLALDALPSVCVHNSR